MVLVNTWKVVVLERYQKFAGRAGRAEFWWFALASWIISAVLSVLTQLTWLFAILSVLYSLAVLLPSLAVGVRRLHDSNHSGWWLLIILVPLVGLIVLIVLLAVAGDPGPNRYGQVPLPIQ